MDKKTQQLQKKQFSVLRKFVGRTHGWLEPKRDAEGIVISKYNISLEDAQEETAAFLEAEELFEGSKEKMIETVRETETLERLVKYLYNSLMDWEGHGVD